MAVGDLTTLDRVKQWLGNTSTTADVILSRQVSAQSRYIQSYLNRTFLWQQYTEVRDGLGMGAGRNAMTFGNDPVTAVSNLSVNTVSIPPSPDSGILQPGYGFDSTMIWIAPVGPYLDRFGSTSYLFSAGRRNVSLTYKAGFLVLPWNSTIIDDRGWLLPAEIQTIPSGTSYVLDTNLMWSLDNQVNYTSNGGLLTKVAGTPSAGKYTAVAGVYTFAAADAGKEVALSYGYVPADVEQSCIDMVSLRYREKDRIGLVSQAVGTEQTTFFQKEMPAQVKDILQQYKRTFSW